MALVKCPECSKQVSDHATACPHCGYPLPAATKTSPPREQKCPQCEYYNGPDSTKCYQCGASLAAPVTIARTQSQGSAGNVLAAVLSFIIPGLGQLCQGRIGAGVLLFIAAVAVWVVTFGLFGWIINIVACIEAGAWRGRPSSEDTAHTHPAQPISAEAKKKHIALYLLLFTLAMAAVISAVFYGGEEPIRPRAQAPSTVVSHTPITARELARRFDDNEVQTEQELTGQRFRVSGWIRNIVMDDLGSSYVVLEGYGQLSVKCMFPWSADGAVAHFHKGQRVSLDCECSGMSSGNVLVKDCRAS